MSAGCHDWRGDLAARALGRSDAAREPGLDAHLDGCPDCRRELDELRATTEALGYADAASLTPTPARPDPALGDRVVARLLSELRAARRRRRARLGAAVAAATVVVAAIGIVTRTGGDDPSSLRVVLAGTVDASGEAELVARPWGTEVTLDATGLEDGDVYWVWLSDGDGDRVAAGTLTGTDADVRAVLASAVPFDDAVRIWVTGEDEEVVLDGRR